MTSASRSALDEFVSLGASGPRFQFEIDAIRQATVLDARASSRVAATTLDILPLQIALAKSSAETAASQRVVALAERLAELPPAVEGLDAPSSDSLRIRSADDMAPIYAAQDKARADAERAGRQQQRNVYGLSLIAVAASLLGLAGLLGSSQGGRIMLVTASIAMLVAVGTAVSGFVL